MLASLTRRRLLLAGAFTLSALSAWLLINDRSLAVAPPTAPPAVPVVVGVAARADVAQWADGIGTVVPLQDVVLRTQVSGVLSEILFREGEYVRQGQLLARVDDRAYAAALAQAQAGKVRNESLLKSAVRDLQRYQNLAREDAISQQIVEQQAATVEQIHAEILAADAAIAAAQVQLSHTRIKSPINGRVGLRHVDPGNVVQPGDARGLVTITQIDPISVVFTLPQQQLAQIRHLMKPDAGAEAAVVAAFDRDGGFALGEGRLAMVDNTVDTATGMIRLRAEFTNGDARLWPGQFVTTRLRIGTFHNALVVPVRSVRQGLDGAFVFRVAAGGDKHRAEIVKLRPAYQDDEIAVIPQGLEPGDRVVVDGYSQLKAGSVVGVLSSPPQSYAGRP